MASDRTSSHIRNINCMVAYFTIHSSCIGSFFSPLKFYQPVIVNCTGAFNYAILIILWKREKLMITWDTVKMHKHRKYKKKLLKTKYRNNDYKKNWWTVPKTIQGHFQHKTLKIVNSRANFRTEKNSRKFPGFFSFSRTRGHHGKWHFLVNAVTTIPYT